MLTQIILAVDDKGKFLEYIPKEAGHKGEGRRHLAITVLIYNHKGEVLLQRRKHKIFDKTWDLTGATHLLHREEGTDETPEQATYRCLKDEYDIENISVKNIGTFNYFAQIEDLCENEHCALMVGEYNGPIKMDPGVGYECKWTDKRQFLLDLESNPGKYTPWAVEGARILKKINFL